MSPVPETQTTNATTEPTSTENVTPTSKKINVTESTLAPAPSTAPTQMQTVGYVDLEGFTYLTPDGKLRKKILKEGQGEPPKDGCKLIVHYVGTLYPSGKKFDSSRDRGTPFSFELGKGQVIAGWEQSMGTMKEGELMIVIIHPDLGYGSRDQGTIPPNSTLQFEVELLSYEDPNMPVSVRLEKAAECKAKGNELLSKFPNEAVDAYRNGIELLESTWDATQEEGPKVKALKLILLSNICAGLIKLSQWDEVIKYGEEGLKYEPENVKLLYRVGRAYRSLSNWVKALDALEHAQELSPEDETIKGEIYNVTIAQRMEYKKEQETYRKMFK